LCTRWAAPCCAGICGVFGCADMCRVQNAAKKPRKLRDLAKELLGMDIQGGEQ
jgi:hypothetical protein